MSYSSDTIVRPRSIAHRTTGQDHGPITRLFSPGDLGQIIKPFVFLDRIDMMAADTTLFGYHPHSGIATITTVFDGDTAYADSTGAAGILKAQGVEWMQAGSGVWHTANPAEPGRVRGYQLWLALPDHLELTPATSSYLPPEDVAAIGNVRVILGEYEGVISPLPQIAPLTYLHVRLAAGERWTYTPPVGHDVAWVAVDGGAVEISGATLERELAVFADGSEPLHFEARDQAELMIGSATRHPHDLVTGHYSVHTNASALREGEAGIREIGVKMRATGAM